MSLETNPLPQRRAPRRSVPLRGLLLSAGVTLAAGRSSAEAQPGSACTEQRLRVEGSLSPQWFVPVVQLCETLGTMANIDRSAQLRVVAAGDDVIVEATLGDGRSTLRRVHAPADLSLTVEALVAVPPPLETETTASTPASAPSEPVARPAFHLDPELALAPARPARRVSLEVGGAVVGRVAGSATYLSIGLLGYAGLRTGPWLLALMARWDGYQTVVDERPREFEMTTVGGGFSLLRELLRSEHTTLEGGVNTWLLGETQAYTPQTVELAGSSVDVRVGAVARLLFGPGHLRYLASVDAELSPGRLRHELHVAEALPTLPGWSLGLGVGVAWEAQ
ncbi:MAG: hypothetical protein JWN48_132 [Myxococcaceae bacterium]|nr:hypothetical protein [Myxococcaceae bacterium]